MGGAKDSGGRPTGGVRAAGSAGGAQGRGETEPRDGGSRHPAGERPDEPERGPPFRDERRDLSRRGQRLRRGTGGKWSDLKEEDQPEVEKETIELDAFYVAFPKDDPRDPPAEISPALIDENRLLLLEDGHCLKDHALAACNRPEMRASATMIGTSLHTLVQMVDNGLGLTMLPEMAMDAGILNGTNVVARPLKSDNANREIALVWRKNSPRGEEFRLLAEELRAG